MIIVKRIKSGKSFYDEGFNPDELSQENQFEH